MSWSFDRGHFLPKSSFRPAVDSCFSFDTTASVTLFKRPRSCTCQGSSCPYRWPFACNKYGTGATVEKNSSRTWSIPKQRRSCFHANVLSIKTITNSSQGASWMPSLVARHIFKQGFAPAWDTDRECREHCKPSAVLLGSHLNLTAAL